MLCEKEIQHVTLIQRVKHPSLCQEEVLALVTVVDSCGKRKSTHDGLQTSHLDTY